MVVAATDIVEYQSASAGSTGGAITGSSITSGVPNNVVPNYNEASRIAGFTDYRKTFWKNNHGTDAMKVPVHWLFVAPLSATMSLGFGFNHADDADSAQGNMTAWGANAKIAVVSSSAGDARVLTVYGMDNSGSPVPTTETITLNGTTEVLSVATYSKVWAVYAASLDGARTVTVKQGAGGTTRGTIAPNKKICWLWIVTPTTKAAGIALPDLPAGQSYGVWRRIVVSAGASAQRPNTQTVRISENA